MLLRATLHTSTRLTLVATCICQAKPCQNGCPKHRRQPQPCQLLQPEWIRYPRRSSQPTAISPGAGASGTGRAGPRQSCCPNEPRGRLRQRRRSHRGPAAGESQNLDIVPHEAIPVWGAQALSQVPPRHEKEEDQENGPQ